VSDAWNRCDDCGVFIPYADFADGFAVRRILELDSDLGTEKWETLCRNHGTGQCDRTAFVEGETKRCEKHAGRGDLHSVNRFGQGPFMWRAS